MGATWWCPAHQGRITNYTLVDKKTGRGRWVVTIRCACQALLVVTKSGIRVERPAPPAKQEAAG